MTDRTLPLPKALSLAGKRIVVTGAANGIGRATAKAAAELGATLLLTDRASLVAVKAEVAAMGAAVDTLEGDLTADGFAEQLIAKGPIDGLAHCAGVLGRKPLLQTDKPRDRFIQTMDVNVLVPITLGSAMIEHMAARGGGRIVMIGSVAGRTGGTSLSTPIDYAASKGALISIMLGLIMVYVLAFVINALAPQFGGKQDMGQAFKLAAYAPTARWVTGLLGIIPALGIIALLGALYSLYLLWIGLPKLMKPAEDKAVGYTIAIIVVMIVMSIIIASVASAMMPSMTPMMRVN